MTDALIRHFSVPIFPEGALDSSVVTTVYVGVVIASLMNLRLGWVLSGLVVPGYLVPLLLVKPWAAAVIVAEAVITYAVVWFLFEYCPRFGLWNSVFGRDRFFALLLSSVAVRLTCDVWLLPWLGRYVSEHLEVAFDYANNLHSFGLIIVALIANQFWKPGLKRAALPLTFTVGATYLFVRYVLIEYTNFSISNLSYTYEDIAVSMLASPKAYIILLTTAYIASRMNLLYGWEYSGILLPSLLALVWYQPIKIAASITEAFVVLALSSLALRLPVFKGTTMEGARKLLLFATVSYIYKFCLSYAMLALAPGRAVTDYFGFGYLLATMIAMKMHEKSAVARITRATLQVSLTAVVAASCVGFTLTFLPNPWEQEERVARLTRAKFFQLPGRKLMEFVREENLYLYRSRVRGDFERPTAHEMRLFAQAVRRLARAIETAPPSDSSDEPAARLAPGALLEVRALMRKLHYRIGLVEDRYICMLEEEPRRGWGAYVLNIRPAGRLIVEAPAPLNEAGAAEAATWIFMQAEALGLALSGADRFCSENGAADVLRAPQTLFHTFHRVLRQDDVLQVRAFDRYDRAARTALYVQNALPPSLNLSTLTRVLTGGDAAETVPGQLPVQWGAPPVNGVGLPEPNVQRETTPAGFAELWLDRADMRRVLFQPIPKPEQVPLEIRLQNIDGFIQDWLLNHRERIAKRGSDAYRPATLEEMLCMDEQVLQPFLRLTREQYRDGAWTREGLDELRAIAAAAAINGYRLIRYRHQITQRDFVILAERDDVPPLRHWGTYVFRLGEAHDFVVQVPRPLYEVNTFEYGVALFEQLDARALLVAGTTPYANRDGAADVVKAANKVNLFTLVNQVLLREAGPSPMMTVQTRAFGIREEAFMPQCDVLLAFDSGAASPESLSTLGRWLYRSIESDGLHVEFVDGALETAGYEVSQMAAALYLNQTKNKEMATIWMSPVARQAYRQQNRNKLERRRFDALGVASLEADLQLYLERQPRWEFSRRLPQALRDDIRAYVASEDVVLLEVLLRNWPQYAFSRVIDINSKQSFLAVHASTGALALLANLNPRLPGAGHELVQGAVNRRQVASYIDERVLWLDLVPAQAAENEEHEL